LTPTFLAGLRKVFREVEQDVLAGMKAMSRAPTWELFDIEKIQAAFAGVGEPLHAASHRRGGSRDGQDGSRRCL